MLDFLDKNFKMPWPTDHEPFYISDEEDASYCHFKNEVAISHGPIGNESRYVMETLLRWIALRVGTKRKFKYFEDYKWLKRKGMDVEKYENVLVTRINYDSEYDLMVLPHSEWADKVPHKARFMLTDNDGIRPLENWNRRQFALSVIYGGLSAKACRTATQKEMKRLSELWIAENPA